MTDERVMPSQVNFDYLKSTYFRTIHVDGAIGGPSPNGHIHIAIYSERTSIPTRIVQAIRHDGALGEIIENLTVTRGGVVRELEADLILTAEVAENLSRWLADQAKALRAVKEKTSKGE